MLLQAKAIATTVRVALRISLTCKVTAVGSAATVAFNLLSSTSE